MKTITLNIKNKLAILGRIHPKEINQHTTIKQLRSKDEETTLKSCIRKSTHHLLGNITKGDGSFLIRTNESQKTMELQVLNKEKNCQFKVLFLPKDSNKNEGKEKMFSYKHQLRQFVSAEMRYRKC